MGNNKAALEDAVDARVRCGAREINGAVAVSLSAGGMGGAGADSAESVLFPLGLLHEIAKYLNVQTIQRLIESSRRAYELSNTNPVIWKNLCRNTRSPNIRTHPYLMYKQQVKEEYVYKRAWMEGTGEVVRTAKLSTDKEITHVQIHPGIVITSSNSPAIKIWDTQLGLVKTLSGHRGSVWTFEYRNGRLASGSTDKTVRIWDTFLGTTLRVLCGHTSTVRCLRMAEDLVISGSRDSTVRVWEARSGRCAHVLKGHKQSVRAMDVDERKGLLVSGSYDGKCVLWNYRKGHMLRQLHTHGSRVYTVKMVKDAVYSGGQDRSVSICRTDGAHVASLRGHEGTVFSIRRDKDEYIYTLSCDGTLCRWDINRTKLVYKVNTGEHASSMCIGNGLVFVGTDGAVKMYNLESGDFVRSIISDVDAVYQVEVTDSSLFVTYKKDGESKISMFSYGRERPAQM